jgi:hypothetical protein
VRTPREKAEAMLKSDPAKVLEWVTEHMEQDARVAAAKRSKELTEQLEAIGVEVFPLGEGISVTTGRYVFERRGHSKTGIVSEAALDFAKALREKADDIERLMLGESPPQPPPPHDDKSLCAHCNSYQFGAHQPHCTERR